jgi:gluconolactonase
MALIFRQRRLPAPGRGEQDTSTRADIEIRDPVFGSVVGTEVVLEKIAGGFLFTEGPLWHAPGRYLLFSDMPGDHLRKWTAREGVATFRKPCAQSNGLAWDGQGRLIVCEHATSRLTRTEAEGSSTVLASHYGDKEFNSPNDVVVRSDGAIYFTDPTYGRDEYYGNPRPLQLDFRGVWRVDPQSLALTLVADDFAQPNGAVFLARRATPVRQRHRAPAHPRVRRRGRRHVRQRPGLG